MRISLPPDTGRDEGVVAGENPMQGARIANITPALADEMQIDMMAKGVIVTGIANPSQAARFGFRQGDIIRGLNGERITTVAQLKRALSQTDEWQMSIQRGDQTLQLAVQQ
jgi:S1-C subfamily serine protease